MRARCDFSEAENQVSSRITRSTAFGQEQLEPRLLLATAPHQAAAHEASHADLPDAGDYDGDGVVGCRDIALLQDSVRDGRGDLDFDVNGDTTIDQADVVAWIDGIARSLPGDANLDGIVDAMDLNQIGVNWRKQDTDLHWCDGNFNRDTIIDAVDLNTLAVHWQQTRLARVTAVQVTGQSQSYSFRVTIESPDTGCDRYADWWEVITPNGELIHRRVLAHSHVNEQPFTRSGGPVRIGANDTVIVRAHMNDAGYGTAAFRGSVSAGFLEITLQAGFAEELSKIEPLPTNCAF